MPRRKKTKLIDRLEQYDVLAWHLKVATQISLDQERAEYLVREIVKLQEKFQNEDYPNQGN